MKKILLALTFILFICSSQAQDKDSVEIFNEFSISISHPYSNLNSLPTLQFGFGIGTKHRVNKHKKNNFIFGLEYNFEKYYLGELNEMEDKYTNYKHLYYKRHKLTIPISYRLCIGNSTKGFIEPGLYFDYTFLANRKAIQTSNPPIGIGVTKEINDNYGQGQGRLGISLSAGALIPYKTKDLLIKTEFKYSRQSYIRLVLGINI